MSLKSFHIFFIAASIVLCVVAGMWFIESFPARPLIGFGGAGVCFGVGASLLYYGVRFLEKFKRLSFMSIALLVALTPQNAHACAVCFGDPTSPLQNGVDAAVWTLLGFTGFVLAAVAGLAIYFTRRAIRVNGYQDRELRVISKHSPHQELAEGAVSSC